MNVRFVDLAAAYRELAEEIDSAIAGVLRSGWYVLGPEVEAFEQEFATYTGAARCIGVGNGLDALTLILRGLEVRGGQEVIVPSNTYVATWLAVSLVGAVPVPVEPDIGTYNLDPGKIAAALSADTAAILAVHLYGQPFDLEGIAAVARQNGVPLVADGAQAHGALYRGAALGGAPSRATAWSFYPTKNLGAFGDGGAVTTDDEELAGRLRLLRNYGTKEKYVSDRIGVNSRLDEIQAAVLRVKLRYLDRWNGRRKAVADRYLDDLAATSVILPTVPEWAEPAWHLFVVRSEQRDALRRRLHAGGVEALVHYPRPPHRQAAYGVGLSLPIADRIHAEVLSLPIGPHLGGDEVDHVVSLVREMDG